MIRLGAEPPVFRPGTPVARIDVTHLSFWSVECHQPTGPRDAAARTLLATLKNESRSASRSRIDQAMAENNPDRLLDLIYALELRLLDSYAGELVEWAAVHHPDHPEVRLIEAAVYAREEQWTAVRDLLVPIDPTGLDDGSARHLCHLLGMALLHLGEPDEALRVLKKGACYPDGRCDLSTLIALCAPLPPSPDDPDDHEAWDTDQRVVRLLMRAVQAADACLDRDDVAGARRWMDRWEVIEAREVQSLARLAEAYLRGEEVAEGEHFDKAFVLALFCTQHAERQILMRIELPLLQGRWDFARLDGVSARASQWLSANLGEAWPMPHGGF